MSRVTVFVPAYNAESHIRAALTSVLEQTYRDFELLVIDDGSTDGTAEVVARIAANDPRIRLLSRGNRGRPVTRNEGLARATGDYVAFMDADDACLPRRLERQVAYLDAHPDCAAVGTAVREIGEGRRVVLFPEDDASIRCALCFGSALANPSAMVRLATVRAHGVTYDEADVLAQDYRFWTRLAAVASLANLPEIHLHYRVHPGQGSRRDAVRSCAIGNDIATGWLARHGVLLDEEEIALLRLAINVRGEHMVRDRGTLYRSREVLLRTLGALHTARCFPAAVLADTFTMRMLEYCLPATPWSLALLAGYLLRARRLLPRGMLLDALLAVPRRALRRRAAAAQAFTTRTD